MPQASRVNGLNYMNAGYGQERIGSIAMTDLTQAPDADLVREIYRRIKGESEMHYFRNYLYRESFRPIFTFFDKQDIDEANVRMRKIAQWEALEATRDEVLEYFPDIDSDST